MPDDRRLAELVLRLKRWAGLADEARSVERSTAAVERSRRTLERTAAAQPHKERRTSV